MGFKIPSHGQKSVGITIDEMAEGQTAVDNHGRIWLKTDNDCVVDISDGDLRDASDWSHEESGALELVNVIVEKVEKIK